MDAMRESWTDDRLDGFDRRVDERFKRVDERSDRMGDRLEALREDTQSEARRMQDEARRELRSLEVRLDRMEEERFREKLWLLQVAMIGAVIVFIAVAASQPS